MMTVLRRSISFNGRCPSCNSRATLRVHRNILERILTPPFSLLTYQCRECHRRFYLYSGHTLTRILVTAGCLGLLGWFLFLATRPQAASPAPVSSQLRPPSFAVPGGNAGAPPRPPPAKQENLRATGVIQLGAEGKYKVRWAEVPGGLQIHSLRRGPFEKAGLRVGDFIISVNGAPATDSLMLKVRNQIVQGVLSEATISVNRGDRLFYFKILK